MPTAMVVVYTWIPLDMRSPKLRQRAHEATQTVPSTAALRQ